MARLAADAGLPWCPVAPAVAAARAALGATTVPLLVALARAGLRPDCTGRSTRRRGPGPAADALLAPGGAAAELARRLGRTIPLVYGSAGAPPWRPTGGRPR